jgi:N-acyl-D-amino-acid deacylase
MAMVGSDGIYSAGKPHPRYFGTFPRILGKYVRQEKALSLPEAVRKMTSFPAQRLNLTGRGLIKEGMWADIVVFDAIRWRNGRLIWSRSWRRPGSSTCW